MKYKGRILKLPLILVLTLVFSGLLAIPSVDKLASNTLNKYIYESSYTAIADVGNHNNYNKGTSTSKSTTTPSSKGSSTTKSSSSTSTSKSTTTTSTSHGSKLSFKTILIVGVIFLVLAILLGGKGDKKSVSNTETHTHKAEVPVISDRTPEIDAAITNTDPLFSSSKFLGWSQEVFMSLQEAWSTRDWAVIRPFEKEELFKIHERQLEEYKRMNRINLLERVCINQGYLYRYSKDAEYEYLTVYVSSTMNDYIIDADTKQVLAGDPQERYDREYLMTFMRKVGVKTNAATSNMSTKSCPNCGAPLNITSAGKCEYCDFIVTTGDHDWVLSDYDSVDDRTEIQEGGVFL